MVPDENTMESSTIEAITNSEGSGKRESMGASSADDTATGHGKIYPYDTVDSTMAMAGPTSNPAHTRNQDDLIVRPSPTSHQRPSAASLSDAYQISPSAAGVLCGAPPPRPPQEQSIAPMSMSADLLAKLCRRFSQNQMNAAHEHARQTMIDFRAKGPIEMLNVPQAQYGQIERHMQAMQSLVLQATEMLAFFYLLFSQEEQELKQIAFILHQLEFQRGIVESSPQARRFIFGLENLAAWQGHLTRFLLRVKVAASRGENGPGSVPTERSRPIYQILEGPIPNLGDDSEEGWTQTSHPPPPPLAWRCRTKKSHPHVYHHHHHHIPLPPPPPPQQPPIEVPSAASTLEQSNAYSYSDVQPLIDAPSPRAYTLYPNATPLLNEERYGDQLGVPSATPSQLSSPPQSVQIPPVHDSDSNDITVNLTRGEPITNTSVASRDIASGAGHEEPYGPTHDPMRGTAPNDRDAFLAHFKGTITPFDGPLMDTAHGATCFLPKELHRDGFETPKPIGTDIFDFSLSAAGSDVYEVGDVDASAILLHSAEEDAKELLHDTVMYKDLRDLQEDLQEPSSGPSSDNLRIKRPRTRRKRGLGKRIPNGETGNDSFSRNEGSSLERNKSPFQHSPLTPQPQLQLPLHTLLIPPIDNLPWKAWSDQSNGTTTPRRRSVSEVIQTTEDKRDDGMDDFVEDSDRAEDEVESLILPQRPPPSHERLRRCRPVKRKADLDVVPKSPGTSHPSPSTAALCPENSLTLLSGPASAPSPITQASGPFNPPPFPTVFHTSEREWRLDTMDKPMTEPHYWSRPILTSSGHFREHAESRHSSLLATQTAAQWQHQQHQHQQQSQQQQQSQRRQSSTLTPQAAAQQQQHQQPPRFFHFQPPVDGDHITNPSSSSSLGYASPSPIATRHDTRIGGKATKRAREDVVAEATDDCTGPVESSRVRKKARVSPIIQPADDKGISSPGPDFPAVLHLLQQEHTRPGDADQGVSITKEDLIDFSWMIDDSAVNAKGTGVRSAVSSSSSSLSSLSSFSSLSSSSSSSSFDQGGVKSLVKRCLRLTSKDAHLISIEAPNRSIGGGGFCDLFLGILMPARLKLAMKRPRFAVRESAAAQDAKRRFEREASIWRELEHNNVLPFYGLVQKLEEIYLISPWMEFGDLSKFVTTRLRYLALPLEEQELDPNQFAYQTFSESDTIYGIASGLEYLHSRGIIHGDIKALNVLLDGLLRPLLCDFGMTKVDGSEHEATSTAMQGAGSMRWMAPELLHGGPKTTKSDVYALGMTIVEILTGTVPFPGLTPFQLVLALHNGDRPSSDPLHRCGQNFKSLWRLAEMCWGSDPTKRLSAAQVCSGASTLEHQEVQALPGVGPGSHIEREVLVT